jgi:hypothetical protein
MANGTCISVTKKQYVSETVTLPLKCNLPVDAQLKSQPYGPSTDFDISTRENSQECCAVQLSAVSWKKAIDGS